MTMSFNLDNSGLITVPTGNIPSGVPFVSLSENKITEVGPYAFNQSTITEILLNKNNITYVDSYAFFGTIVTIVDLSYNALSAIPDFSLVGSTLESLYLRANLITSVIPSPIPGLVMLKNLDMAENNLGVFPNLTIAKDTLQTLDLESSGIPDLVRQDIDYFQSLTNLRITAGTQTQFPNLTAMPCIAVLKVLWVSSQAFENQIIDPILLNPLVGLEQLKIVGNDLISLPILTPLRSLQKLHAVSNDIDNITAAHFEGLNNLFFLTMSHNRLTRFPDLRFLLNSLTIAYFNQNDISMTGNDDWFIDLISGMKMLTTIGLEGNRLTSFPDIYHGVKNLTVQQLYLRDNPLVCDCSIAWFKDAEGGNLNIRLDDKPCSAPSDLVDVDWASITKEMMCACKFPYFNS